MSTPVSPLGSGIGGGVELSIANTAQAMIQRGHQVTLVAPSGSQLACCPVVEIEGNYQVSMQKMARNDDILLPHNSVLANMWNYARLVQDKHDVILNFAYDWLPLYLSPFFTCSIAHIISMGSLTDAMDSIITKTFNLSHRCLAFRSYGVSETFGFKEGVICIKQGIDLSKYQFSATHHGYLSWIGRISPEKALEDALTVSRVTGIPLKIFGKIQDHDYWLELQEQYSDVLFEYGGFLPTEDLQAAIRHSYALLMTPRWVEAFGNVIIEALACGVPVISYARGGPMEIIEDGKTGFLVEPDQVSALIKAVKQIDQIDRFHCRQTVEKHYSLTAMGQRLEDWLMSIYNEGRFKV